MTRVSSGRRSSGSSTSASSSSSLPPPVQTPTHSTRDHSVGGKENLNSLSNEKKRKSISNDVETLPSKSPSSSTVTPRNRARASLPSSANANAATPTSLNPTGLPLNLSQFSESLVEQITQRYGKDSKLKGVPNVS
jgi:CCR4-NOT transcriptional regulation complex NOT5 subunit